MMPQTFAPSWQPMSDTGASGSCSSCSNSREMSGYEYEYEVVEPYGDSGVETQSLSPTANPQHAMPPAMPDDSSTYHYRASSPADYEAHQRLEQIYQAGFHKNAQRVPLPGRRIQAREYHTQPVRSTRPMQYDDAAYRSPYDYDNVPTLEIHGM